MESDEEPNGLTAEIWWPLISPQLDSIGDREVQQTAANRVRAILGRLCFDALTAFEFSLTSSSPKATPEGVLPDISQKIERPDQAEHLLKRWGCSSGGWTELLGNWASARRSSESDSIVSPGILGSVRSIWLEFDLGRSPEPQPVICLTLPPLRGDFGQWLALFGGQIDRAAQAAALNRCVDMLPPAARTMYLFDLSARSIGWVRLEIVGVSVPEMPSYLDKIGVSPPRWLEVLGPAGRESDRPHLSFDIGPDGEIGPRIGVEVSFSRLPHREPRWLELMDELSVGGLFDSNRRRLIHDWFGQSTRATGGDLWPAALHRGTAARVLSHFKLAGRADADRPEAKGYLLFQYRDVRS